MKQKKESQKVRLSLPRYINFNSINYINFMVEVSKAPWKPKGMATALRAVSPKTSGFDSRPGRRQS